MAALIVLSHVLTALSGASETLRIPSKLLQSSDRLYVLRRKGSLTHSIVLRSDGRLLYGTGGRIGTRTLINAGYYKIRKNEIVLQEIQDGEFKHETFAPYTPNFIGEGKGIFQRIKIPAHRLRTISKFCA
jgi:hypothetical protein